MLKSSVIVVGLALLVRSALPVEAGDLTPPPGPVSATDRVTLNPASLGVPIVLDEPGSYVLTGPVLDCIGCDDLPNSGIVISASDVTLDCNGFAIVGDPENSLNGIFVDFAFSNVVIRNGTVRGWSNAGVIGGSGIALEDMRIISNGHGAGEAGITLGSESRVRGCVAQDNAGMGIFVGFGSSVQDCSASGNAGDGIHATVGALTNGSVVRGCVSRNNGGVGFSLGDGTIADACAASQNGGGGFVLSPGSAASACTSALNTGNGFDASNALVHGCSAAWNTGADIALSAGAVAIDSHDAP